MHNTDTPPQLQEYLEHDETDSLQEVCSSLHPATIADSLADLETEEIWEILNSCDIEHQAEIFAHLDVETQLELAESPQSSKLDKIVTHLSNDDLVDFLKLLPEERQQTLISAHSTSEQADIIKLSSYPEGTAGSIMTTEFMAIPAVMTVDEAIAKIRKEAPDKETIYYSYIIDEEERLLGFVSLKDLILASGSAKVGEIMDTEMIFASVEDDQEEVANKIAKFDLIALPVINGGNKLVGIVTHDDAVDIINQEHTEDIEKLMAITGSHEAGAYLRTSTWDHFKNRVHWLVGLAILGLVSGAVIHSYEQTLVNLVILALYMPMIADTGGNTGSQAATMVIRALALKEIDSGDIFRVLFKELKVSLLLAGILALLAFGKVLFLSQGAEVPAGLDLGRIGFAISVALGVQVISSTLIGATLPMIATRLKLDPAAVASPALTTFVDITGLIIYFSLTRMLLNL